jgi:hypothetical protein
LPDSTWADNDANQIQRFDEDGEFLQLYDKIKQNEFKPENLIIKFDADFKSDEESESFSGQIKLLRDSVIEVNVIKLGYSFAKFILTKNQVWIINRHEKTYLKTDYRYFKDVSPRINFNFIQETLLQNQLNLKHLSYGIQKHKNPNEYIIANKNFKNIVVHKSKYDKNSNRIKDFFVKDIDKGNQIFINYRNVIDGFANEIIAEYKEKSVKKYLSIEISKVQQKKFKVRYRIPKSYTQLYLKI